MKRILAMFLCLLLVAMTGCGGGSNNSSALMEDSLVLPPEVTTTTQAEVTTTTTTGAATTTQVRLTNPERTDAPTGKPTVADPTTGFGTTVTDPPVTTTTKQEEPAVQLVPIDMNKKLIALTFDDAPHSNLQGYNDLFIQTNSRATYFINGKNLQSYHADELKRAVKYGMELGNHGQNHVNVVSAGWSVSKIKSDEYVPCNNKVKNLIGYEMKLLRPAELAINENVKTASRELGMPIIGRVVNPGIGDWKTGLTEEDIYTVMMQTVRNNGDGSIILCHMTNGNTLAALRRAIPELQAEGYQFVAVSEMFAAFGYDSIPLGTQLDKATRQN